MNARGWSAALAAGLWLAAARAQFPTNTPVPAFASASSDAAATVVVYNNADPLSLNLAGYYAEKRGIPFDHLIGLDCAMDEEISRADYDRTIAGPLRKIFAEREWWRPPRFGGTSATENKIRYLALMRGVPLKVAQAADQPGDSFDGPAALNRNEASVDSELAALGFFSRKLSGPMTNRYFRSFTRFAEANLSPMMLVCRLDAPTGGIVRRMIDDSIATEQRGLWGFVYVDGRGITDGGFAEGDRWLARIAAEAREHGFPVIEDRAEAQFDADYPLQNVALYFGWYGENAAPPFARDDFHFNPGAIACHIHSTSAATVRNPHGHWVAPLLVHGVAATLGNVYEPYLALTPNLDVFFSRLRNGFNFAESAYASERVLSWMTVVVGDPLYRPFHVLNDEVAEKETAEWIAYRKGARTWFGEGRAAGELLLLQNARQLRSGLIFEGLGLLQKDAAHDRTAALASFEEAQKCYTNVSDLLRVVIHRVGLLRELQRKQEALGLARKTIQAYSSQPGTNAIRRLEVEMAPASAPSPSQQP